MSFESYAAAGFGPELLPILPPDAAVSPESPGRENLERSRGKVPGRLTRQGWVGFHDWTANESQPQDFIKWSTWKSGIGLQGRKQPAVDIDVEYGGLADAIEAEALFTLGLAPCRFGRGSRRILVYSGAGLKKRRLAFRIRGGAAPAAEHPLRSGGVALPERGDGLLGQGRAEDAPVQAVELLGDGQQYVIEGIHPKTGQPYHWRDGSSPAEWGAEGLTVVTAEELDKFLENVRWLVEEMFDGEIIDLSGTGRAGAEGGRGGTWQPGLLAPSRGALVEALAAIENDLDYDAWFKFMVAVKAACGARQEFEDGVLLFADWSAGGGKDVPDVTEAKWDSIRAPYAVGWDFIARLADERTAGQFNSAGYSFPTDVVGHSDTDEPPEVDNHENMFARYAWVEGAKRAVDLRTGELLDQEQLEFRIPPKDGIVRGPPEDQKPGKTRRVQVSAWKVFKDAVGRRKSYKHLTCRFGGPLEVVENLPDLQGLCLNTWRAPKLSRPIPAAVTDDELALFFKLAAHVIPIQAEREHAFNFMAFTAQRPGEKINHALVLGSRVEGMGKDTLIEPLRAAIGRSYVREIGLPQLTAPFNRWLVSCKLLVVQEMHNFERRATMNLLKPLVAAPPEALPVNLKGMQEFFVPNLLSTVFFTNEGDALAVQNGDRRYFITWNDGDPMPKAFYDEVWDWFRAGGTEKVVRWLLQRDVTKFDAKGRAPETAAKETMRRETRAPLAAWLEDAIADQDDPFERDLFLVDDVVRRAPDYVRYKGQAPGPHKIARALKNAGAKPVSSKIRIPGVDGARVIWACRRVEVFAGQTDDVLRGLFVKQRDEAESAGLKEAFG